MTKGGAIEKILAVSNSYSNIVGLLGICLEQPNLSLGWTWTYGTLILSLRLLEIDQYIFPLDSWIFCFTHFFNFHDFYIKSIFNGFIERLQNEISSF